MFNQAPIIEEPDFIPPLPRFAVWLWFIAAVSAATVVIYKGINK